MDTPPAQYVTTSDGKTIAYGISGSGPPFVLGPIPFSHVQLVWGVHNFSSYIQELAQRFRVIHIDPRGLGMSERGLGPGHRLEDGLMDIEAVVEAEGLKRFVLFGAGTGGHVVARYAAKHPEQIAALILAGFAAKVDRNVMIMFDATAAHDWETYLRLFTNPNESTEYRSQQLENLKRIATPQDSYDSIRATVESGGSEDVLRSLEVPVMVLQARDFRLVKEGEAAHTARLARGRLFVVDGATAYGDPKQGARAMEAFLKSLPPGTLDTQGDGSAGLSLRELEVLRLIATGRSNAQIAETLVISPHTVVRHVSNILNKIGAANRAEATAYALRNGLA
jgi:pimeloyl-ACP methyl ester carboxylesterase/DNA-binding CsgD family transcriptional regulator